MRKHKALYLLLAALFVAAVMSVSVSAEVRLTRTRITLEKQKSATISLKGSSKKVSWSVSGKKLVAIRTKGTRREKAVIKAGKKAGSCFVVAKAGKKTYRCRVIVKKSTGFSEKALSASAVDRTASYKAKTTKSLAADSSFTAAYADSAVKLLREAAAADTSGNILLSPDSVLTCMSMLMNGAKGTTLKEMEAALGGISAYSYSRYLSTLNKKLGKAKQYTYENANSIWYRKGSLKMKKRFLQKNVSDHGAQVYEAPFGAKTVKDINRWVYNRTRGKIASIIDRLDKTAQAVVINAVYFKGSWPEPYRSTAKRTFAKADGSTQTVDMLEGAENIYLEVKGAPGFIKYYAGGGTAFMALLPPQGTDAEAYVRELTGEALVDGFRNRVTKGVRVYTRIPVFQYEYQTSLKNTLGKMGMKSAFTDAADFSGMADRRVLIDDVLHKTFIRLDKEGTEAAAVTAAVMKASSVFVGELEVKEVYLDRPFVYAIIDAETGVPLFLGLVREVKTA